MNLEQLKIELGKRLTSINDAYNEVAEKPLDFSMFPESKRAYKENQYHAEIIIEAARKIERECGFGEIDWTKNQAKWVPWFRMSPASFAFDDSFCAYADANAGSGSRLRVLTECASDYIAVTFLDVFKNMQLG